METKDTRASATPDDIVVDLTQGPSELPPGLKILTAEELQARESEAAGEATPEETEAAIENIKKEIEARETALADQLVKIGPFVLLRFEHQNSINIIAQTSKPAPSRDAMIAAMGRLVRQLQAYENFDDTEEARANAEKNKVVTLPTDSQKTQLNREERRFLAQIERKLRG